MSDRRNIAVLIGSSLAWREQVMRGIAGYANETGHWHVFTAPEGEEYTIFAPSAAGGYRWDGLIVRPAGAAFARRVLKLGVPVVSVGSLRIDARIPRVKVDDVANTALILRHLLAGGLRHFAYCSFLPNLKAEDRGPAFVANVRAAGHRCQNFNQSFRVPVHATWTQRLRQLTAWLRSLPKPVGILAYTPDVACQLVDACNRAGIAIPDEVAIVASDDDPMKCELSQPTVSAAEIPAARIGYEAAKLLDRLISGATPPVEPIQVPPTGVLAMRQSTAIAGSVDREVHHASDLIRQAPPGTLGVSDVAEQMKLSPRTLQRHFRRVLGITPRQRLQATMLDAAKRLLLETDWPASRVAVKAGFHSPSHFNRVMRTQTGLTPLAFRAKNRLGRN